MRYALVFLCALPTNGCIGRSNDRVPNAHYGLLHAGGDVCVAWWPDGKLRFAFVSDKSLKLTRTSNPRDPVAPTGVFWVFTELDDLWVNGTRVSNLPDLTFFAINRRGTVIPLNLSQKEIDAVLAAEADADLLPVWKSKIEPAFGERPAK